MNETKTLGLPYNFPYCCTDEELEKLIKEITNEIVLVERLDLVHKYSAFTQIGLIELNNRQLVREQSFVKEQAINADKNTKNSFRLSRWGLFFSIIAVLISILSAIYPNKDHSADTVWQEKQNGYYTRNLLELKKTNVLLDSLLNQKIKIQKIKY